MKRVAKIFLAGLLILGLAIIGLTIYVKVRYPSERLKEMLISWLAQEYGIRATIERLDFNLFAGFELDHVAVLGAMKDSIYAPAAELPPLAVQRVKFAYRWRSLFSRQLDIDEIIIERPIFFYKQAPDSSTNLDAILAAFADTTATPKDTSAAGLPISINLKTCNLHDLQINAVLASAVDTQKIALGPLDLEINQIEIDRQANFSGTVRLQCDPADLRYTSVPVGKGAPFALMTFLESNIAGFVRGDSVTIAGDLAIARGQVHWGSDNLLSLPRLSTNAQVRYDLASSHLLVPDFRFLIDDKEQLAAYFELVLSDSVPAFVLHVYRGVLDLGQLLTLAKSHLRGEILATLQNVECAGSLEFSGSALQSEQQGMHYVVALAGHDLAYDDHATGLHFTKGQLQIDYRTKADSTTELTGKCRFETFDIPIDTQTVLKTGPAELAIDFALAKDFLPQQGNLDFTWQNFSGGELRGHAAIRSASPSPKNGSWLSRLLGEARILADSVELATLSANAIKGKINGQIALSGKRLDELMLTCDVQNTRLGYKTEEYHGEIPAYHILASSRLTLDPSITWLTVSDGRLQFEPGQVNFNAVYDLKADSFRVDFPTATLDVAQILQVVPDTLMEGVGQVAGTASVSGWLRGKFVNPDSLDYEGFFTVRSDSASYHDAEIGLYADHLRVNSQWWLTALTTIGEYSVACPAPRLPDYLRQPLPPTTASGKLTVEELTFTITEGKLAIPDWHANGIYHVDGEFRPAGIQVKTTVDLGLHAPEPISVERGIALRGDLFTNFVYDQYIPDALDEPQPARLVGRLQIDGLDITVGTIMRIHDLKGICHFDQDFDYLYFPLTSSPPKNYGMLLEPDSVFQPVLVLKPSKEKSHESFASAGEALLMYDIFRGSMNQDMSRRSWLRIGQIDVLGHKISEVIADLVIGNCRFDVPKFSMNLFGGNLVGNLLVGLGNGNPQGISYATTMQLSSIDVSNFRRLGAELQKESRLSADFFLSGSGASAEHLAEVVNTLSGRLNITKIENQVASNLLQALDPNGTDQGIQRMRLLLKTGWNVKQMTFEMKNGFIYASLLPVKPWFAPFNLPPTLDFARLPMKYFLESSKTE